MSSLLLVFCHIFLGTEFLFRMPQVLTKTKTEGTDVSLNSTARFVIFIVGTVPRLIVLTESWLSIRISRPLLTLLATDYVLLGMGPLYPVNTI